MQRAQGNAGFFVEFPKCRQRQCSRASVADGCPSDAFQRLKNCGIEVGGEGKTMVRRVAAPTGKDVEVGHEDMRTAASAHQHAHSAAGAVKQHDRCCVTRPYAPLRAGGSHDDAFAP
ncbi:hypothetical protein D9M72_564060 [compost metagenome]